MSRRSPAPALERRASPLHALVVDDSAVVRRTLGAILSTAGGMRVTTAPDALFALERIRRDRPDVVVLDLEMPRMDGLSFLDRLRAEAPLPVVVCSAAAVPGSDVALRALDKGALEVVAKPRLGVREFLQESAVLLVDAVRAAHLAGARSTRGAPAPAPLARAPRPHAAPGHVVALGASTGGTEALRVILSALPPDAPPLIVVQHMPEFFTGAFARRLDAACRIAVEEASDGARVGPGRALVAPGNRHMTLERRGTGLVVRVTDGPLVSRHRPSVDVLFASVARAVGSNATGVILTGMGADGAAGLLEMRLAGARTLAQDAASAVVFGMPQAAIVRGAVSQVVGLDQIAETLLSG